MRRKAENIDPDEEYPTKRRHSLARKVGRVYMERAERKREEPEESPLHHREGLGGSGLLHLRLEEEGRGTLLVNGTTVVHLNPSAVEVLRMLFDGESDKAIVKRTTRRYKVKADIARQDLEGLKRDIRRLEAGRIPSRGSRVDPLTGPYQAPFRADLALTYRMMGSVDTPEATVTIPEGEMDTEDWLKVIDKIWLFGIPHICVTGGEPTVREDLVEVLDHATGLGMVTGILTNGERLGHRPYLGRLMDAGLRYAQVSIVSHDEGIHSRVLGTPFHSRTVKGMENCLKAGLPTIVNILMTKESEYSLEDTVEFLVGLGVGHITVNPLETDEEGIPDWIFEKALERARRAAHGRARIFWFGPVPGKDPRTGQAEPVGDLAIGDLEWGGGRFHVHVHPDGTVTAGRRHPETIGSVLAHGWNMIWYHSTMREIREKHIERNRWKALGDLGFHGYPLFPGPALGSKAGAEDEE